ncbi:NAD(P)-binding domain-containing protein [Paracoccus albicereus]|nr:NAD(P)-binding domain-containing protein [Paracoccus albicereus]
MTTYGFIGTGAITDAIVRGLKTSPLADRPILLSPRSQSVSAALAADLEGITVATDNQAVIDGADVLILAVLPQHAGEILRPLTFPAGKPIISLIAATPIQTIAHWTRRDATDICRAIPLPSTETRTCATPVYPPRAEAMKLFEALGQALAVEDAASFDTYGAASALMAPYFAFAQAAADWLSANGLPQDDAQTYVRTLFANLGATLRDRTDPITDLRKAHQTTGGLNELAGLTFDEGGPQALGAALDAALARVQGRQAG